MKIQDCLPHLLYQFSSEQDVFNAITEISKKFTIERENISDYLQDQRLVSAYTLYYLLTNIPKFEGILKWLPPDFLEVMKSSTFIDMGAGPGTYSIAYKQWAKNEGKVYQVETSQKMREQARKLWNGFYPADELIQGMPKNTEGQTVMFFGHSANEMGVATSLDYIKKINPDHIIFLEPGTKSFFAQMLEIRKALLKTEWNQVYPCSAPTACPMEGTENWCHQYLHHVHTVEVERMSQKVGINRRYMAMTLQVFSKNNQFKTTQSKIIQIKPETKFSYEWVVCTDNELIDVQIMKRGLNKAEQKKLEALCAGELITYQVDKVLEGEKTRVILL